MFFRLALYPIEMKIDIKKQFFTTLSDINISFFCINKERKVQETIQAPLKIKNPLKNFKTPLKKTKNHF